MRNFFYSINRLLFWLPIILKDRYWDDYFIWTLLQHKFKSMERFYRYKARPIVGDNRAKRIRVCKLLLKRITDDNYLELAFRQHEIKWGELKFSYKPYKGKLTAIDIHRTKVTPETEAQERIESKRCHELEDYLRKQDLTYLFYLINKYSRGWWD